MANPTDGPVAGPVSGSAHGQEAGPANGSTGNPAHGLPAGPAAGPAPRPVDSPAADRATSPAHGPVDGPVDGPVTASANGSVSSPAAEVPATGRPDGPTADPALPSADGRAVEGALPAGPVRPDAHREQPPDATPEFDWLDEEWAARNGYRTPERRAPSGTDEKHTGRGRQDGRRPGRRGDGPNGPRERGRLTRWLRAVGGFGAAVWLGWIAALGLVVCGVVHLPLRAGAPSAYAPGISLGISTLCLLLGAALVVRRTTVAVLAAGVLFPALLAVAHLTAGRLASPLLADVLATGGDGAALAAALAAVLALAALLGALAGEGGKGRTTREEPGESETPGVSKAPEEPVPASVRGDGS
jgi:Meckel syndrome type 1 protein